MTKKYKVRLHYTMIQDRIVTAENPWHAQQKALENFDEDYLCLLYTSPSPRDPKTSRMPSSA